MANVAGAWEAAQPEQRNHLARLLFEEILINDVRVGAVKPRPERAGFFLLNQQCQAGMSNGCCTGGPDGVRLREYNTSTQPGSGQTTSALPAYFPLQPSQPHRTELSKRRPHRLPRNVWPEIQKRAKQETLRQLAAEYGSRMRLFAASSTCRLRDARPLGRATPRAAEESAHKGGSRVTELKWPVRDGEGGHVQRMGIQQELDIRTLREFHDPGRSGRMPPGLGDRPHRHEASYGTAGVH